MANLSTNGLEELVGGFDAIAELPDEVVLEMLVAEAEVIAPAQEADFQSIRVLHSVILAVSRWDVYLTWKNPVIFTQDCRIRRMMQ